MKAIDAVRALNALAQDSRLAIYRLLVQTGEAGLPVGEIADRLKLPNPTLTAHLNVLRHAGLVRDTREGRSIRCRADYRRMDALLGFLTENCCGESTNARAPVCATTNRRKHP